MIGLEVLVLVPFVTVRHLHETDPLFGKPPRHQALPAEVRRHRIIETVKFVHRLALAA